MTPAALEATAHATAIRWYAGKKNAKGGKKGQSAGTGEGMQEFDDGPYREKMDSVVNALRKELSALRVGGATPALLDPVRVDVDGQIVPLTDIAQVLVKDAGNLLVLPHEDNYTKFIEKAITTANLNLAPVADARGLRVPIPKMTPAARMQMAKKATDMLEKYKVQVRDIRQKMEKNTKNLSKQWSKDEIADLKKDIAALTKKYLDEIAEVGKKKAQDIKEG